MKNFLLGLLPFIQNNDYIPDEDDRSEDVECLNCGKHFGIVYIKGKSYFCPYCKNIAIRSEATK